MRLRVLSAAALLGAFGALGCATFSDPAVMFHDTQRHYTQLMRFTEYAKAGHFVAPDARGEFRHATAALGDLHFTDYEVADIQEAGNTATAEVHYIGYRSSDPVTVTYVETQEWERDGGVWLVRPHISAQAR
jgi:hypothetical protein